ncbi:lipid droplet-associated hydrolase-like [Hordeum vulgare subsp. vulgare]|nr:lipid droplet-associated hydrolase-like [Hordeum vulgare subsp. vulgare]
MGSCLRCARPISGAEPRLFRPAAARRTAGSGMERAGLLTPFPPRARATARISMVSSFATELLEIRSREPEPSPSLHVLVVPGNPGIVGFYKDFVEALYEDLGGRASVTAIGHISHGQKDYEHGRLFSLHEQIEHKIDFLEQELLHTEQSIIVVGHSIGAYIGLEICKRFQKKVIFFVGLYPFLTLNKNAMKQSAIGYVARSSLLSKGVSLFASFIGSLQASVTRSIVKRFLGSSWSATAIDAGCSHLLQYHTMRNVLFMAKTEFLKLYEEPDWNFIRAKQDQIAFLFGVDDHWGPLTHLEEISRHAPGVALSIEKEGHTHGYCCTEAGSFWVADYTANLIKNRMLVRDS